MQYALLFLLLGISVTRTDAVDCSVSNGGCEQYCMDRGDGNGGFCGCDCFYQLNVDGLNCDPNPPCDVDLLFYIDATKAVDAGCVFPVPGQPGRDQYEAWKVSMQDLLTVIGTADSTYAIGMSIHGLFTSIEDYASLDATLIATLKTAVTNFNGECGTETPIQELAHTFAGTLFPGQPIVGPTGIRDATTTSRIAVVGMLAPVSTTIDDATVQSLVDSIRGYYDQIFVVGSDNTEGLTTNFPSDASRYVPHMNLLACNDSVSDCALVTYVDKLNPSGQVFSDLVPSKVDTGACIKRKTKPSSIITCSATDVVITIPSCILGGLIASDLNLNNASCTGGTYATTSGGNIVFTVPFSASCGWTSTTEVIDGTTYLTITNQVQTTGTFGAGTTAAPVTIDTSCRYPRFTNEQLGVFNPVVNMITATINAPGAYSVVVSAYPNSSYVAPFSGSVSLEVNTRVYFDAVGTMPGNTFLVIKEAVATSDTSPTSSPSWTFMENNCINDTDFIIGTSVAANIIRFSFLMFEWSATANQATNKLPLYIHTTYSLCTTGDTTARCTQSCATRRKRDVGADEEEEEDPHTVTHTIGPFIIRGPDDEVDREEERYEPEVVPVVPAWKDDTMSERRDPTQMAVEPLTQETPIYNLYLPAPTFGVVVYWFILILTTVCLFHFVAKCFFQPDVHRVPTSTWFGLQAPQKADGGGTKVTH